MNSQEISLILQRKGYSRRSLLKGAAAGALGLVVGLPRASSTTARTPLAGSDVLRTLVAHEITHWETAPNDGYGGSGEQAPILSGDGRSVAFARAPGSADPANPNRIFVIGADGIGEHEVDAYTTLCYCGSMIDLSDDGSRIVSSDAIQLRVATAGGGDGREVIALDSNEIDAVRISGDGQTVVFRVYRDTILRGDASSPVPRGIYTADVASGEWRQIVGVEDVAPLLDVPVDQVSFFGGSSGLDASTDGSRIIFTMHNAPESGGLGQNLFTVNGDGSGLTDLLGRVSFVLNSAISGDGATIAYISQDGATNTDEVGVMAFGGGNRRKLTDSSRTAPGIGMNLPTGERIQLSSDGSRLLLGSTGFLVDTEDGTVLQLGVRGSYTTADRRAAIEGGLFRPTMNGDATRFLYLIGDDANVTQLATLDLDPADLGDAPVVSEAAIDVASLAAGSAEVATIVATVESSMPIDRVGWAFLRDGRADPDLFGNVMLDDGANADTTAADGRFSTAIQAGSDAAPGERTLRIKAEIRTADGRRHATAIDVPGIEITDPV